MKITNIKKYLFDISLLFFLFLALFVPNNYTKLILASLLLIYALICKLAHKKENLLQSNTRNVTITMLIIGILYVAIYYLMGIYWGYYESTVKFGSTAILKYILPIMVIIISSEIIRYDIVSQEKKYSKVTGFIITVFIDIILYAQIYDISILNNFLIVIGYIFFSSCANNLLFNYISSRCGYKPIIVYRLITTLYLYIIPITPNVYTFLKTVIRIIIPYIIYIILEGKFKDDNFKLAQKNRKIGMLSATIVVALVAGLTMLISCEFKYGILVVGSNSMQGTIQKGDAVIFEKYDGQELQEGQIIIFNKDNVKTIHRIEKIQVKDNEYIYYTKGDNNEQIDEDYRTNDDIIGIVKLKILYIGWPTIMVNEIFNNL